MTPLDSRELYNPKDPASAAAFGNLHFRLGNPLRNFSGKTRSPYSRTHSLPSIATHGSQRPVRRPRRPCRFRRWRPGHGRGDRRRRLLLRLAELVACGGASGAHCDRRGCPAAPSTAANVGCVGPWGMPTRTFSTTLADTVSLALGLPRPRERARRCCRMISPTSPPSCSPAVGFHGAHAFCC